MFSSRDFIEKISEGLALMILIIDIKNDEDLTEKLSKLGTEQLKELNLYLSRAKGLIDSVEVKSER